MKRILSMDLATLLVFSTFALTGCSSNSKYPSKPIQIVVSSTAGGGTDLGNRALAAGMEEVLGVKMNVVNVPAGGGGAAMMQV